MREITENIWKFHVNGRWVVVTTNGDVNSKGRAVMGRGIALQAAQRYPSLPYDLAERLQKYGNHVHYFNAVRIFTFPTKHHWPEQADLALIERSAVELRNMVDDMQIPDVYLPRAGCSNGRRKWEEVKPIYERVFENDERFTVVSLPDPETVDLDSMSGLVLV